MNLSREKSRFYMRQIRRRSACLVEVLEEDVEGVSTPKDTEVVEINAMDLQIAIDDLLRILTILKGEI